MPTEDENYPDEVPDAPYGIICPIHWRQGLTKEGYAAQMARPDSFWRCPVGNYGCPEAVEWDDDRYEKAIEAQEESEQSSPYTSTRYADEMPESDFYGEG